MANEMKRVNMDLPKELWYQVGVESAKLDITKREFAITALKEKLERLKEENHSE